LWRTEAVELQEGIDGLSPSFHVAKAQAKPLLLAAEVRE
jgi:hypothetical protein